MTSAMALPNTSTTWHVLLAVLLFITSTAICARQLVTNTLDAQKAAQLLLAFELPDWTQAAAEGVRVCSWKGVYCLNQSAVQYVQRIQLPAKDKATVLDFFLGLPASWGQLASLRSINISLNVLGTLPPEWGQLASLRSIDLSNNKLTGTLPPEWGQLANLQSIVLSHNSLEGTLPPEWGQMANLQSIDLSANNLKGTLPPQWGQLASLQSIILSNDSLEGTLPPDWGQMVNLQSIVLSNNSLEGTLPPEWGDLSNLEEVNLVQNKLNGTFPGAWTNFSKVHNLLLSSNELSGSLPIGWFNRLTKVQSPSCRLYLDYNSFSGKLPEIQQYPSCESLRIVLGPQKGQGLTGSMPNSFRALCVKVPSLVAEWGPLIPSGLSNTFDRAPVQAFFADWQSNGCIYPYARVFVYSSLAVVHTVVVSLLVIGSLIRRRDLRTVSRVAGRWATSCTIDLTALYAFGRLIYAIGKPILILGDLVSDCLTIRQVWPSFVAYVLMACVFLPDAITSLCLAMGTMVACRRAGHTLTSGVDSPPICADHPINVQPISSGQSEKGTNLLGTLSPMLEKAIARVVTTTINLVAHAVGKSPSYAQPIICCVVIWPVMFMLTPLLVLLGCLTPAKCHQIRQNTLVVHPGRVAELYDRFAGSIEAPVTAGFLYMLLIIGIRYANHYVVESAVTLYISISFSLVHFLTFWWEMVWLIAHAENGRQLVNRLQEPFLVVVASEVSDHDCASPVEEAT